MSFRSTTSFAPTTSLSSEMSFCSTMPLSLETSFQTANSSLTHLSSPDLHNHNFGPHSTLPLHPSFVSRTTTTQNKNHGQQGIQAEVAIPFALQGVACDRGLAPHQLQIQPIAPGMSNPEDYNVAWMGLHDLAISPGLGDISTSGSGVQEITVS